MTTPSITPHGFKWGAAEVTRLYSRPNEDYVRIGLTTPKYDLQIYVTPTGVVRIHDRVRGEWKPHTKVRKEKCESLIL